jgi:hypothetical protein
MREVKLHFWRRYKLRYPAEITPADTLVSRCHREMEKRLLTVFDIWSVKNMMHQVTSTRKRKRVGTDLYMMEEEAAIPLEHSTERYLDLLHTYLLAIAIAGTARHPQPPSEAEGFGTDSARYIVAPWDILEAYYFRAKRTMRDTPDGQSLNRLERLDVAERAAWVAKFREGAQTIGQVVQQVFRERDAHWEATAQESWPTSSALGAQVDFAIHQADFDNRRSGDHGGRKGNLDLSGMHWLTPGAVAEQLRDGTKLCEKFQEGQCRIRKIRCADGVHKCGKVTAKGRICAMPFHGAANCRKE